MSIVCPSWLSFILYNPVRKAFTDRQKIVTESGITKDSVVLEVGAGNGFITEALAENAGKAYSVELQEGMIQKLTKRVQKFGNKVAIIRGDIASIVLEKEFIDVCLLYYCFHEVYVDFMTFVTFGDVDELVDLLSKARHNSSCHDKRDLIFPEHCTT